MIIRHYIPVYDICWLNYAHGGMIDTFYEPEDLDELRNIVGYSESEIPAVFISIGNAPEKFMITGSQRVECQIIHQLI